MLTLTLTLIGYLPSVCLSSCIWSVARLLPISSDTYDAIEIDHDGIELAKLIQTICHLQDHNKKDIMDTVETNNQMYLFYHPYYESKSDCTEAFKARIKVRKSQNGEVGYHPR